MNLEEFFKQHRHVAIAFSGGVDSAYLLYAARQYADSVKAYYVKTAFQPEFELQDAVRFAGETGVSLCLMSEDVLCNETITKNPENRCYFCKQKIFSMILKQAHEDGYDILLDGTNASDDAGDRPGMRALQEMKVLSPLRDCGLTKKRIRELSKEAGLFTWDKPSYACLATRIPHGTVITQKKLEMTEKAEDFMMSLGFSNFRVRMEASEKPAARIEVTEKQIPILIENRKKIISELKNIGYEKLLLNLETRNEQ